MTSKTEGNVFIGQDSYAQSEQKICLDVAVIAIVLRFIE